MSDVKYMIDSMFFLACRNIVLSNKGGESIEEKLEKWLRGQRGYEMYSRLKIVLHKAHVLNRITETEYKFVLCAIEAAVYG